MMDIKNFVAGKYKKGYEYSYFLPSLINKSFTWSNPVIGELLEKASFKLGELNSFARLVPDIDMFIKMLVYKEAVVSSKIEGTQTNIEEALTDKQNIDPEKRDDWEEVNNYVKAMNYAIKELETFPLSNRLIKETHKILLSSGRGKNKNPGEFRLSQNWIGGATIKDAVFVPPIHTELPHLLSDFEKFLNNNEINLPHLIKIAIAHYQFETIHPFLDGNGRIGRLLITLYLVANEVLEKPLLYLSDFFETNRTLYYQNLNSVRVENDLEQWIKFFLIGVKETAEKSVRTLKNMLELKNKIEKEKILTMGKRSKNAVMLFHALFSLPVISIKNVQEITNLSPKAANDLVKVFVNQGILKEMTGYNRNRIFIFEKYLDLFENKEE
jgi:Fic family protein